MPGIYQSGFTNVRFSTKIEFSTVVKCRWGSRGAISTATSSWWSPSGDSGGKTAESFGLFTSGGQLNNLKYGGQLNNLK